MNIVMLVFSLVNYENTSRNGQVKKIMGNFSENIRNNWTGFICQRYDLIRQRTGFIRRRIRPVHRLIRPVPQQIKPVHLVLIFSFLFLFCLTICFWSAERVIPSESAYKTPYSKILC